LQVNKRHKLSISKPQEGV